MKNNTHDGFALSDLETLRDGQAEVIKRTERRRSQLHGGDPVALRGVDADLVGMRFAQAEVLLLISMKRRDAGDHQGALDAARLYAEQEYLAKTVRDRLDRAGR